MGIKIEITADTPEDLVNQLVSAAAALSPSTGDDKPVPETKSKPAPSKSKPKPSKSKTEEPAEEPAEEPKADSDPKKDKVEAIGILMPLYSAADKDGKDRILSIAKEFGATKFGEVPDEKGTELLAKAKELAAGSDA